jgi:hypothetical protein
VTLEISVNLRVFDTCRWRDLEINIDAQISKSVCRKATAAVKHSSNEDGPALLVLNTVLH